MTQCRVRLAGFHLQGPLRAAVPLFSTCAYGWEDDTEGKWDSEQFQGTLSSSFITMEVFYTMTSINFILSEDKPTLFSGSELYFEIQWDLVVLPSLLEWPPCYEVNCIRVWSEFFPVWFALRNFVWLHSNWL